MRTSESTWKLPLKWDQAAAAAGERHRAFCASLADVFDEEVADEWRDDLFALIYRTPHLDWLLLTKRPERIMPYFCRYEANMSIVLSRRWPLPNVWLGTSVENQKTADERIPELLQCPAEIRFLSVEPLLEPVDLLPWLWTLRCLECHWEGVKGGLVNTEELEDACPSCHATDEIVKRMDCLWNCGAASAAEAERRSSLNNHAPIDWVIVGGESGPGARPMNPVWVRQLVRQCQVAGTPAFVKQMGTALAREWNCSNKKGGSMEEWPLDLQVRQFPLVTAKP